MPMNQTLFQRLVYSKELSKYSLALGLSKSSIMVKGMSQKLVYIFCNQGRTKNTSTKVFSVV